MKPNPYEAPLIPADACPANLEDVVALWVLFACSLAATGWGAYLIAGVMLGSADRLLALSAAATLCASLMITIYVGLCCAGTLIPTSQEQQE